MNYGKRKLNTKNGMKKVLMRFPNESFFIEFDINMGDFTPEKEFETEVFGWYKGVYVSIKR